MNTKNMISVDELRKLADNIYPDCQDEQKVQRALRSAADTIESLTSPIKHANGLALCPFCGGEAEIVRKGDGRKSTIYQCTECSCTLETSETFNHGELWNRRFMGSGRNLSV